MNHLLCIQCADRVGLVHLISRILAGYRLNITEMREFVDEHARLFFTRIMCDGDLIATTLLHDELSQQLPEGAVVTFCNK